MRFSLTGFNFSFTPSRQMFVLALITFALLLRLGFWQLERAHEKQHLINTSKLQSKRPVTDWQPGVQLPEQYQPLRLTGHFLPNTYLLDNQHHQHQFGYDVLSPYVLTNGAIVLIDRGWIKGDLMRYELPKITIDQSMGSLTGHAYYPSKKHWLLGAAFEEKTSNITIIELIDPALISQFLHKSVYPFIIRLNKDSANGYVREWPIVSMPASRHYGYAVQWFAMAFVVGVIFISLNLKRQHD